MTKIACDELCDVDVYRVESYYNHNVFKYASEMSDGPRLRDTVVASTNCGLFFTKEDGLPPICITKECVDTEFANDCLRICSRSKACFGSEGAK